jgi:hypothetical protein
MEEKQTEKMEKILEDAVVLETSCAMVAGVVVQYRLLATRTGEFWIAVDGKSESVSASLGRDLRRAIGYFDRIVEGGATPCSIVDVVADLLWTDTMV